MLTIRSLPIFSSTVCAPNRIEIGSFDDLNYADVAELVDAHASGRVSLATDVEVPSPPIGKSIAPCINS